MDSPKELPVEEKRATEWPMTEPDNIFGDHVQTLFTIGIFGAILIAFLGICVPLFLM